MSGNTPIPVIDTIHSTLDLESKIKQFIESVKKGAKHAATTRVHLTGSVADLQRQLDTIGNVDSIERQIATIICVADSFCKIARLRYSNIPIHKRVKDSAIMGNHAIKELLLSVDNLPIETRRLLDFLVLMSTMPNWSPEDTQAYKEELSARFKGQWNEQNVLNFMARHTNIKHEPATESKDAEGADMLVRDGDTEIEVDIKSSATSVIKGADGAVFLITPDGISSGYEPNSYKASGDKPVIVIGYSAKYNKVFMYLDVGANGLPHTLATLQFDNKDANLHNQALAQNLQKFISVLKKRLLGRNIGALIN